MHEENLERLQPDPTAAQAPVTRPQAKTISLYPQDMQRLATLRQELSTWCGRPVSASALMRVALRKLEQNWTRKSAPSGGDDVA